MLQKSGISFFSCPNNYDVEYFIKNTAVEFEKQGLSVTYLVYAECTGTKNSPWLYLHSRNFCQGPFPYLSNNFPNVSAPALPSTSIPTAV